MATGTEGTCFIIQPFDNGGPFDRRYEDVYEEAVIDAGLDPYRVDKDPGVTIPIEEIEKGIKKARACFADVSIDNPNVWFELGYAIATQKDVAIVCEDKRKRFPFDIQHRNIITYSTESVSDFKELQQKITERLQAILEKESTLAHVSALSPIADVEGLSQSEIAVMAVMAENIESPDSKVYIGTIRRDMGSTGFTQAATTIALLLLIRKEMLSHEEVPTEYDETTAVYRLTKEGVEWLLTNADKLTLRRPEEKKPRFIPDDDDVPF